MVIGWIAIRGRTNRDMNLPELFLENSPDRLEKVLESLRADSLWTVSMESQRIRGQLPSPERSSGMSAG